MKREAAFAVALGLMMCGAPAAASTFDIFGYSGRDIAMGGAMTSASYGYSSVYYNPAALTLPKKHQLGLGLTLTLPAVYVDRQGGAAADEHPTATPSHHVGISLGWLKPIGGIFDNKLAAAISLYVPGNRLIRVQGLDPQSPQFYRYQNLQDKLLINAGLAYEPVDWLSVGVGAQVLVDVTGGASLDMNIVTGAFDRTDLSVVLEPTAALFAGIHVRPAPGLAIGFSYRGSSSLQFRLPVVVAEGDALDLTIDVSQTVLWSPHQLSFGLSYQLEEPKLLLALDATYALWSEAPDPSPQLSVDIGGRLLGALGLADALDLSTRSRAIDLGFVDTITARVGAEWEAMRWLVLRAGYFFRPTPAPNQTGVTAYLDNDAHVISLGAGFSVRNPLREEQSYLDVDIGAQVTVLPRRTAHRTDPRDPVGDLSHGGTLWTVVTTVSHSFE